MKKYYTAILLLVLLYIVSSAVLLILSPDIIPAHYGINGQPDRWGSKYENLLFPAIAVLIGVLFTLSAKKQQSKAENANAKPMLISAVAVMAFFNALTIYLGIKAIALSSTAGNAVGLPGVGKFFGVAMGALLCLLGNIMPKVRMNSVFGLRTKWSKANDRVWQKSQRFSGITAVAHGIATIIASILLSDMWIFIVLIALTVVWVVLCIAASYRYYKDDMKAGPKGNASNA